MPNETKRIAVRPNKGSALQRAVDHARADGQKVSDLIHTLAEIVESDGKRKAKREKANAHS